MAANTQFVMDGVFDILGWDTKEQLPFSDTFEPLGVTVDLKSSVSSIVTIRNKASRIQELETAVTAAVRAGSISVQDARRLRGRFVFARAQAFGRCGAPAMRMLGVIAEAHARSLTRWLRRLTPCPGCLSSLASRLLGLLRACRLP